MYIFMFLCLLFLLDYFHYLYINDSKCIIA
nr:MAG TPA: hypothetical protein [Caudoviricetes sp.]